MAEIEITYQLSAATVATHKRLLQQQQGRLPIGMHLFYEQHARRGTTKEKIDQMIRLLKKGTVKKKYYPHLLEYLRSTKESMIIGEEESQIEVTLGLLRAVGYTPPLYFFLTKPDSPVPVLTYTPLMDHLRKITPQNIIVSGQHLSVSSEDPQVDYKPFRFKGLAVAPEQLQYCVGRFVQQCLLCLDAEITSVQLSKLTFPAQRD